MDLEALRAEIAALDAGILEAFAKRVAVAREIGALKQELGLPVRNLGVESGVRDRHLQAAARLGLDRRAVGELSSLLIQEAIEGQASLPRPEETRRRVMVVGGAGKMGRWVGDLLSASGHSVTAVDPALPEGPSLEDARGMDVVIVSTPISAVDGVLRELEGLLGPETLVFDLASLKSPFQGTLERMAGSMRVCSVHPMFGPGARSMYDRNLLFCDCGCRRAVDEAMELLDHHGARMTVIPLDEHDRYMSYVLGMSHAVSIAFLSALESSGISSEELGRMASTTFRKQLESARSVGSEDPALYHEIQNLNLKSHDSWRAFSEAVARVREASLEEDPTAFRELMERGRAYLR